MKGMSITEMITEISLTPFRLKGERFSRLNQMAEKNSNVVFARKYRSEIKIVGKKFLWKSVRYLLDVIWTRIWFFDCFKQHNNVWYDDDYF